MNYYSNITAKHKIQNVKVIIIQAFKLLQEEVLHIPKFFRNHWKDIKSNKLSVYEISIIALRIAITIKKIFYTIILIHKL